MTMVGWATRPPPAGITREVKTDWQGKISAVA